jgi:hypothetical protein
MLDFERRQILADSMAKTVRPEWTRIPEASKACGIGRTRLYELLNEAKGAIRTFVLKSPGAERGARLIHLPSLFAYFEKLAITQEEKA